MAHGSIDTPISAKASSGPNAFRLLLNDERFAGHPGILETPKGDDGEEDRRNLATLSALVGVADASLVATP